MNLPPRNNFTLVTSALRAVLLGVAQSFGDAKSRELLNQSFNDFASAFRGPGTATQTADETTANPPDVRNAPPVVADAPTVPQRPATPLPVADEVAGLIGWVRRGDYFCIDSNVWMNRSYEPALQRFVAELVARKAYMRISAVQLAEIQKIRKDPNKAKVSRGSRALRLMTEATRCQAAIFEEPSKGNRVTRSYLDDALYQQTERHLRGSKKPGFAIIVTDDIELSGRLMSLPTKHRRKRAAVTVLSGREFSALMGIILPPTGIEPASIFDPAKTA